MVYYWLCRAGHECAVSAEAMRQAVVEPRCPVMVGAAPCAARLLKVVAVAGQG